MGDRGPLPFDPIERAGILWEKHVGDSSSMRVATSIMRVQQLLLGEFDRVLKPLDLTFARFEVLRLVSFSREGRLPLSIIGERLMVHPTSVTNAIDRLAASGLVARTPDDQDRRRVYASLTSDGKRVLRRATKALMDIDFGLAALNGGDRVQLFDVLRSVRASDFSE
ncbi:MAG TPA: MarR family transcriptional regulator [Aeromicrobium sp.]|nr:MarR family transcriptional regulator [Aeromicrobium sp.]